MENETKENKDTSIYKPVKINDKCLSETKQGSLCQKPAGQDGKCTIHSKEKKLDTRENNSSVDSTDEKKYTTSPDGKYKIPISEFDSDRLEENKFNIPQIKIPGWVVSWPHDLKANSIPHMVDQGWRFISPNEPGCEAVSRKVVAGRTQAGETAFHYAMKMPESKFKEMQAREEGERQDLLKAIQKAPSEESKAIYSTDQMKINNRGLVK